MRIYIYMYVCICAYTALRISGMQGIWWLCNNRPLGSSDSSLYRVQELGLLDILDILKFSLRAEGSAPNLGP